MFARLAKIPGIGRWHDLPAPVAYVSRSNHLAPMTWLPRQLSADTAIIRAEADYG